MNLVDYAVRAKTKLRGLRSRREPIETIPKTAPPPDIHDDMSRLFYDHNGRHISKWSHYLPIYDRHLSGFRGRPVRMLEIGVFKGGSLQLWRKYLGKDATIFGIDIDESTSRFDDEDARVRIGSQADPNFLRYVVAEMGGIDIVLDDGSHVAPHQRISFETLYPLLNKNGLYVVEDLHTAYWHGYFEGGFRRRGTFIEEMKSLIDDVHYPWHRRRQRFAGVHESAEAIHFYNSMVVIEKRDVEAPTHIIAGSTT